MSRKEVNPGMQCVPRRSGKPADFQTRKPHCCAWLVMV